jgi:hypothetical protein
VAAIIIVSLSIGFLYQYYSQPNSLVYNKLIDEDVEGLVEQTNNSNKPKLLHYQMAVLFYFNSKLSYQKNLWVTKESILIWRGFFEISKILKAFFFVYTNEIVTKVVGTSF